MKLSERISLAGVTETLEALMGKGEIAANQFRLPFNRQHWRGQSGNWAGAGIGSSIDFQDHRPYVPGDDPRYINWQAYARTGSYSMKLYREEVSPQVDLVIDTSESMFVDSAKVSCAIEFFYFACQSAWRTAALLNAFQINGRKVEALSNDAIRMGDWEVAEESREQTNHSDWSQIPWRAQSLRVIVSDLLFDSDPEELLSISGRGGACLLLFSPYTNAEENPDWLGNLELLDCESKERARRYFTREDVDDYQRRYQEHFALWQEAAIRHNASLARMKAERDLADILLDETARQGGVELCR
ncbi:DUF58 domain-containing protein [Rubellicoccus peritrichatus]|uniref:DUF58 domain-containing protein n=1 Tax=Rubellicoccus peritrichatus TaxID=3080537 RepID=A0AAQ3L9D7_9BACT|nr:DUF58 domain-containing protein [Puniceicoccus sp. CR14]WOO39715.1 DUF58 domain-containing protein [Puniceicoccus sp. CR14]